MAGQSRVRCDKRFAKPPSLDVVPVPFFSYVLECQPGERAPGNGCEVGLPELFDPVAREIYDAILAGVVGFGEVRADEKKTSVHLVANSAFAGVHPRKGAVLLNIRTEAPIESERIRKLERVSAKRFHNEMLIDSPAGVDTEVIGWLRNAYALSVGH
jgi:hypothetical protein